MKSVKAVCDQCDGTGLYIGFAEPPGFAAVCGGCGGDGWYTLTYKPWTRTSKRRGRRGVRFVTKAWGRGTQITYKEFLAGKRPQDDRR